MHGVTLACMPPLHPSSLPLLPLSPFAGFVSPLPKGNYTLRVSLLNTVDVPLMERVLIASSRSLAVTARQDSAAREGQSGDTQDSAEALARAPNHSFSKGRDRAQHGRAPEARESRSAVVEHVSVPRDSVVPFEIVVLTMKRPRSLALLLESLEDADYGGDRVALTIRIDFSPDREKHSAVRAIADAFEFSHGRKRVIAAEANQGLRGAWFSAWLPASEDCRAVIFEDDIRVAPSWYVWLRAAWEAYGARRDVAGIGLMRQNLIAEQPWRKEEIVNGHEPFLYALVGTIGLSPHPAHWRTFLSWTNSIDLGSFDVYIPGLVTSEWWQAQDKRHMWSQHFIYFCKQHDLYTLHVNLPGDSLRGTRQ